MKDALIGPDGLCTCESCQQAKLIVRLTDQMVADKKTIEELKDQIEQLRTMAVK